MLELKLLLIFSLMACVAIWLIFVVYMDWKHPYTLRSASEIQQRVRKYETSGTKESAYAAGSLSGRMPSKAPNRTSTPKPGV